jgi:predicted phosphodiesterase
MAAASLALCGVFGHNDGDHEGLQTEAAKGMGSEIFQAPHSLEMEGRRLLLLHDIADVADRSLEAHQIVVHGGRHVFSAETRGDSLIVCPGEACGWLHGTPTAAILDLESLQVETITLDAAEWRT